MKLFERLCAVGLIADRGGRPGPGPLPRMSGLSGATSLVTEDMRTCRVGRASTGGAVVTGGPPEVRRSGRSIGPLGAVSITPAVEPSSGRLFDLGGDRERFVGEGFEGKVGKVMILCTAFHDVRKLMNKLNPPIPSSSPAEGAEGVIHRLFRKICFDHARCSSPRGRKGCSSTVPSFGRTGRVKVR